MDERQRRIARARLLRREGKTYAEIRAVIGPADDQTLAYWLRGIARPPATLRGMAKDELRRECRQLRAAGFTYDEIAARTGASKGSISPWVRDVKMPAAARVRIEERCRAARRNIGPLLHERALARHEQIRSRAAGLLGDVDGRDLFIAGIAIYWSEGSKDKEWRRSGRVTLINSDPTILRIFLAWLDLVGIPEADRSYRLNIHETADVPGNEQWWARELDIPLASFARATIKRHNPTTVRKNSGESYHGCLVVTVARSGELYYSIEGWWRAFASGVEPLSMRHTEAAISPP
jgi:transcriptional regulator with XRE-family HTH domain